MVRRVAFRALSGAGLEHLAQLFIADLRAALAHDMRRAREQHGESGPLGDLVQQQAVAVLEAALRGRLRPLAAHPAALPGHPPRRVLCLPQK